MGDYTGELELEHVTENEPAVKKFKLDWVGISASFMGRGLTARVCPMGRVAKRKRVKQCIRVYVLTTAFSLPPAVALTPLR